MQVLVRYLCVLILMSFAANVSFAGSFKVFPLKLNLNKSNKTTLFKITNTGDSEVTVQLETAKWWQNEDGEDQYDKTNDIVYFPKIVKVEAGQQRIIRIGYRGKEPSNDPANSIEQTYRIFAQELPELGEQNSALKFSLRFSVPIFVYSPSSTPKANVTSAKLDNGHLKVFVHNEGQKHFVVKSINAKGRSQDGEQMFSAKSGGWYVLPNVTKPFSVALPENECRQSSNISFKVDTTVGEQLNKLDINTGNCVVVVSDDKANALTFSD